MATLDNLVMTTALPVLRTELSASLEQLQWMVNAYTLSFATLMIAAATLGDRWGRRRVFVAGIVALRASPRSRPPCPRAPRCSSPPARVQGAGAAAIMPLSLTLLAGGGPRGPPRDGDRRSGAASPASASRSGRSSAAPSSTASRGRRSSGSTSPSRSSPIPLVLWALPESYGRRQPLDLAGLALAGSGILALVWAIIRGNDDGWGSVTRRRRPACSACAPGSAFLLRESRTDHPLVPLRLFRVRSFSVANASALAFSFGVFGLVFLLAQYLQIGMGYTPLRGRHPHAAVDRRADDLRADRRDARTPARRPPAAHRRARPAGRRPGVAGAHRHHRRPRLRRPGARPGPGRHRHGPDVRAERDGRALRHGARRPRHRELGERDDPRDRRRARRRGARRGVHRVGRHPDARRLRRRPAAGGAGRRRGRRRSGRSWCCSGCRATPARQRA